MSDMPAKPRPPWAVWLLTIPVSILSIIVWTTDAVDTPALVLQWALIAIQLILLGRYLWVSYQFKRQLDEWVRS